MFVNNYYKSGKQHLPMKFNRDSARLYDLLKQLTECCRDREVILSGKFGFTVPEARCLNALVLENCSNTTEFASKLNVAKSRITRIVDGLIEKGILERSEDKKDRRYLNVTLTEAGEKLSNEYIASLLNLHDLVLSNLPSGSQNTVLNNLEQVHSAMIEARKMISAEI